MLGKQSFVNNYTTKIQAEVVKSRREGIKTKAGARKNELFPGANLKDLISTSALRPPTKIRGDSPAAGESRLLTNLLIYNI